MFVVEIERETVYSILSFTIVREVTDGITIEAFVF